EILFSVFDNIPVAQCGGLFAVGPDTGRIRAIAGYGREGTLLQPWFSPDGRTVTAARLGPGLGDIPGEILYRIDGRTGATRKLATSVFPCGRSRATGAIVAGSPPTPRIPSGHGTGSASRTGLTRPATQIRSR